MTSSLFDAAMSVVKQFQGKYEEAQGFRRNLPETQPEIDAFDELLNEFAFRKNGTAPTFEGPFFEWCLRCFELSEVGHPDSHRPEGRDVIEVVDGKRDPHWFFEALDRYAKAIQDVLNASAPASFSYQGFKIENPERMGEKKCRAMLEGVDYVVALFKKRGVTPLLRETLSTIWLRPVVDDCGGSLNTHGCYRPAYKQIDLSAKMFRISTGRFIQWVNEVFLHEIGHHVHLNYLSPDARHFWDSGWQEIKEKNQSLQDTVGHITSADRRRYFEVWKKAGWDTGKAAAKLQALDKIKFGVWLRSPMTGDPLITAKQFRLTNHGKSVVSFLRDSDKVMWLEYELKPGDADYQWKFDRRSKQVFSKLGLTWNGNFAVPSDTTKELLQANPGLQEAVNEALAKLEIISDYGKENEKEDFAETFVAFMGAPEKLTPTAKFRMQRTLSLSGLYGKPLMRLARKVLERFLTGSGR